MPQGLVNGSYTRTNGAQAESVYPIFRIDSVEDPIASAQNGRPIFREEERVEIVSPGNPHHKPVFKVTDEHRQRWPEAYAKFKAQHENSVEGTPLEEWPRLKRGQVLELKALGFMTVEHIAGMNDLAVQRIGMGGSGLRSLAKAFLDDAERTALSEKLQADNDRKDAQIAELSRKVDELSGLLTQMHGQVMDLKNAPSPIAAAIPALSDPIEQAKRNPEHVSESSLDALAAPRRGRPPKQAAV